MRFLIALAVLFSLSAVAAPASANASETERILTRLENDWAHALVRRETATFHRLIAPGFVYTEDATIMNKEELIRSMMADRVTSARNEEMKVHPYGATAVVTEILRVRGSGKEGAFDRHYQFTDPGCFEIVSGKSSPRRII
jgi:ketosteroid isomerase-like protein